MNNDIHADVVALGVSGITAVVLWLWHKARGEKTQSVREMLMSVVESTVHQMALAKIDFLNADKPIEHAISKWFERRGINPKPYSFLIHEMVAYGLKRLSEEYKQATLPATFDRLLKEMADTVGRVSFEPPKHPDVPVLGIDIVPEEDK